MQAAGHQVFTPTLTGCGERSHLRGFKIDLNTHITDVVKVLEFEDLRNVILCGHSYGATVMRGVAEQVADRIAHLVIINEGIPQDGQAIKDVFPDDYAYLHELAKAEGDENWVSPASVWMERRAAAFTDEDWQWAKSKLTSFPISTFETPLSCKNPIAAALPRTFIACTESAGMDEALVFGKSWADEGHLWTLATMHDAAITQPKDLSDLLLRLA